MDTLVYIFASVMAGLSAFFALFGGTLFTLCIGGACIPVVISFWGIVCGIGALLTLMRKKIWKLLKKLF